MFGNSKKLKKELKSNEEFLAKGLKIGVTVDDIMASFNAFDWLEIKSKPLEEILSDFKKRTGFKNPDNLPIMDKAFSYKMERAILNLSALVEEVNASYKIPTAKGISNVEIDKYYYLKYWADKKNIAVNYNETNFEKRNDFNFYTILFDIFADKLSNLNAYNRQKNNAK